MADQRTESLGKLVVLMDKLRSECPWDAKQTHTSLRPHLLEETYEVLEALDYLDEETGKGTEHLKEELGDLLLHIVFHSRIAEDRGHFDLEDVANEITEKLVRRHPHVFPTESESEEETKDMEQMASTWESIKKKEKNRSSVFEGIPKTLPALSRASKVLRKASALGINQIPVEIEPKNEEAFGEVLLGLVEWARINEIDPEETLRVAVEQYAEKAKELE